MKEPLRRALAQHLMRARFLTTERLVNPGLADDANDEQRAVSAEAQFWTCAMTDVLYFRHPNHDIADRFRDFIERAEIVAAAFRGRHESGCPQGRFELARAEVVEEVLEILEPVIPLVRPSVPT